MFQFISKDYHQSNVEKHACKSLTATRLDGDALFVNKPKLSRTLQE